MKFLLALLLASTMAFAQSIPEPGEWQNPAVGIGIFNDHSVLLDIEQDDNYLETTGHWSVEQEGKYAGSLKLSMTVVAWIANNPAGTDRINITPKPPQKFTLYLIKTKLGTQSLNSLGLQTQGKRIYFKDLLFKRGNGSATRPIGNA